MVPGQKFEIITDGDEKSCFLGYLMVTLKNRVYHQSSWFTYQKGIFWSQIFEISQILRSKNLFVIHVKLLVLPIVE